MTVSSWQHDYWQRLSRRPGWRPVLDPADAEGAKNRRIDEVHRAALHRLLGDLGGASFRAVLDFGCGVGRHHDLLSSIATRYVGVDIAEGMVERAPGEVHLIDGLHLPFDGAAFDCIFSFWVLQHVVEDQALHAILEEFRRCVVDGGHVIICERSARRAAEPGCPDAYIRRRPSADYVRFFREHGFRLERVRKVEYRRRLRNLARRLIPEGDNLYAFTT